VPVALRRSALRVASSGRLVGSVVSARRTPDLVRLTVEVAGVGVVHAVAEQGQAAAVGEEVRLNLDLTRTARLRKPGTGVALP
jgi:thiamine transport system ATP-binding protein